MTKQSLSLAGNCLLVFIAVLCTFGAIISSFSLPVNMSMPVWLWMVASVVVSIGVKRYRLKGLLTAAGLTLLFFLLWFEEIINGSKITIHAVSTFYSYYISVPVFFPEAQDFLIEDIIWDTTIFFVFSGVVIILLLSFTICLYRSFINTILVTLPIIFLTFIVTRLQADTLYLFGIISVYLALLISNALCSGDSEKREILSLPAFAISIVIMLIAYAIAPQATYVRNEQINLLGYNIKSFLQMGGFEQFSQKSPDEAADEHAWLQMQDNNTWQFNRDTVSIADAGRRTISGIDLLEVTATAPGTFYLRGNSMLYFNGRSWWGDDDSYIEQNDSVARSMPAVLAGIYSEVNPDSAPVMFEMRIRKTGDLTPGIVYKPYFGTLLDNRMLNVYYYMHTGVRGYLKSLEEQWPASYIQSLMPDININTIHNKYTEIDETIAAELRQYAVQAGINTTGSRSQIADSVGRYVMTSARYTLSPNLTMPSGEPDSGNFTINFFEHFREGYCIHFTTAAVLMLRAHGIPARFTSGYVVIVDYTEVGETLVITDRNAHAWVEVFYEDAGWLYLEVTPPGDYSLIPPPRPHTPPEPDTSTPPPLTTPEPDDIETPPPTPPSGNGADRSGDDKAPQDVFELPEWVISAGIIILCTTVVVSVFPVNRLFILKRREKYCRQKNTNAAVIYSWRYIKRLNPPESTTLQEAEELAMKARFSLHRLNPDERAAMIAGAKKLAAREYNDRNSLGRFWMKYVRGQI